MVRTTPFLAAMFSSPPSSLAGVPPLSGFISKFALLEAGIDARQYWIVAVSLVVSFLTLFSMIRIWMGAFWSPPDHEAIDPGDPHVRGGGPILMVAPTAALVVASLVVAVAAGPFSFSERRPRTSSTVTTTSSRCSPHEIRRTRRRPRRALAVGLGRDHRRQPPQWRRCRIAPARRLPASAARGDITFHPVGAVRLLAYVGVQLVASNITMTWQILRPRPSRSPVYWPTGSNIPPRKW